MSAADPATPRSSRLARLWTFVVELWEVLRRPSSVFGLGVLVFAGSLPAWCSGVASIPRWN